MLVKTISKYQFRDCFPDSRKNSFTYDGFLALYDYLDEMYEGQTFEVDPVAICGDFSEYEDIEEFRKDYGEDYQDIEDIEYETIVIPIDDYSFIIQKF